MILLTLIRLGAPFCKEAHILRLIQFSVLNLYWFWGNKSSEKFPIVHKNENKMRLKNMN